MVDYSEHASASDGDRGGPPLPEKRNNSAQTDRQVRSAQSPIRPISKLTRVLLSVSVVLVASALTLLLGEIFVRVFVPTETLVPLNEVILGIIAERPNIRGIHVVPHTFRVSYSTSAQRFRSAKLFAPHPDPRTARVAILGDSFTFGWGANDGQAYPDQLERSLNSKFGPTEVLNAGVCGTGTGNEALWYDLWVRRFHPNLVILTVVPNDTDDDLARPLFSIDASGSVNPKSAVQVAQFQSQSLRARQIVTRFPGYDYLTANSELLNLFRRTTSALIRRHHIGAVHASAGPSAFETVGLRLLGGEVEWLDRQVRAAGGQLLVVFVPFRQTVYGQLPKTNPVVSKSAAMVETLTRICAQYNIPFRDLTSEMRTSGASGQPPIYYTKYDAHPTPTGYKLIADLISPTVVEELQSRTQSSAISPGVK